MIPEDGRVGHDCRIVNSELGKYTEIGTANRLENSSFDDYSYSGEYCIFQNTSVGRFSNIAAMVRVGPTAHPMQRASLHHFTYRMQMYGLADHDEAEFFAWRAEQRSYIGHDTWIGHGAIIMPGIRVGDGAVVGSGAVVTRDVPPYTVAAGVPARNIKERFPAHVVEALMRIQWWHWSHEELALRLEDFRSPIEQFIKQHDVESNETHH